MSNNGFTKKFGIDNLIKNVTVVMILKVTL